MARFKPLPVIHCLLPRVGDKAALLASVDATLVQYFSRSSLLSTPVFETSNLSNCSMKGRKLSQLSGSWSGWVSGMGFGLGYRMVVKARGQCKGSIASHKTPHSSTPKIIIIPTTNSSLSTPSPSTLPASLSSAMICSRLGGSVIILACWSCPLRSARRLSMVPSSAASHETWSGCVLGWVSGWVSG